MDQALWTHHRVTSQQTTVHCQRQMIANLLANLHVPRQMTTIFREIRSPLMMGANHSHRQVPHNLHTIHFWSLRSRQNRCHHTRTTLFQCLRPRVPRRLPFQGKRLFLRRSQLLVTQRTATDLQGHGKFLNTSVQYMSPTSVEKVRTLKLYCDRTHVCSRKRQRFGIIMTCSMAPRC